MKSKPKQKTCFLVEYKDGEVWLPWRVLATQKQADAAIVNRPNSTTVCRVACLEYGPRNRDRKIETGSK
jgi:hypothetical protein